MECLPAIWNALYISSRSTDSRATVTMVAGVYRTRVIRLRRLVKDQLKILSIRRVNDKTTATNARRWITPIGVVQKVEKSACLDRGLVGGI